MKVLFDAIMVKYTGVTPTWTPAAVACTGGLHREFAPQKKVMPYAVMHHISGNPEDTFTERGETYLIQFNIYTDTTSATTLDTIASAFMTLFDWCTLTVTGYYFIDMHRVFQTCYWNDELKNWTYVIQYRIQIQKTP